MTTSRFPELAAVRTSIAPDVVATHLETITAALETVDPLVAGSPRWTRWRRWLAGLFVGVGVLVPGAAFASDSALPGDLLYPVKKLLEPVVALVDGDVVAEHRIEEVELLVGRGDPTDASTVDSLIDQAVDALDRLDSPSLEARLDAVRRIDLVPDNEVDNEVERDRVETPTPVDRGESDRDRVETPTAEPRPDRTPTPTTDEPSPPPTDRVEPVVPDVQPTPTSPAADPETTPTPPTGDRRPTPTPTTQPRRDEPRPTPTPTDRDG